MEVGMVELGRFGSRSESGFADRMLSARHREFGGRLEKAAGTKGGA